MGSPFNKKSKTLHRIRFSIFIYIINDGWAHPERTIRQYIKRAINQIFNNCILLIYRCFFTMSNQFNGPLPFEL